MNRIVLSLIAILLGWECLAQEKSLCREVDPFIGTGFHGHTYPGATVPFGAVQLSPDTRRGNWDACAGYHYSDSLLFGFSHTHLSGTGCVDLGDILFCPFSGELSPETDGRWMCPLVFSHEQEWAEPGYYKVVLPTEHIQAELTATPYTGVHRYQFENGGSVSVVIDLGHLLTDETIKLAELERSAVDEISGMRSTQGWVDNQYIYFVARFSRPFRSMVLVKDGKSYPEAVAVKGGRLQAIATFDLNPGEALEVRVGLSLVGIENARENLIHDLQGLDFDGVRKRAEQLWENALSDIQVEGGTPEDRKIFYTSLYRCKITPNRVSDVNGEYRRHDMTVGKVNKGQKQYSTFSFWDTFRAWHPLMTLLDTALVNDMIQSVLNIYEVTGELPVWPLSAGETGTMIGYHAVSVIADAWMKGIRGFDGAKALEAMVTSAEKNSKGAEYYIRQGFIPADSKKESVSCLLEFAYDDWAISRMAAEMGEREIADRFALRAQNFMHVFDGATRFFRGKRSDGNWEVPFNPYEIARSYTEANAWQYRFFVPHDVNGMIQLYGGREAFLQELDSLFTTTSDLGGSLDDLTGLIGQYAHGNEPSHHMAYLYSYAGEPWKTQRMTRRILKEMYQPTPEGVCGNEDCGQMSAWYVMSSLGFYPVCPGSNEFILTTPLFSKIKLKLANRKILVITAHEPEENIYIRKVWLNGKEISRNFLTYEELMQGGELRFDLSATPNLKRATSENDFPYSMSNGKQVSIPYVRQDLNLFEQPLKVEFGSATIGAEIYYTMDGSEPDQTSFLYQTPVYIDRSCVLKVVGYKEGYAASPVLDIKATKAMYRKGELSRKFKNGTFYRYYEGKFERVTDLEKSIVVESGYMLEPNIEKAYTKDHFGYIWTGWIYARERGIYEFGTKSDDGSVLMIGEQKVVDNDGSHGVVAATGRIALEKGFHPYTLFYFEDYEGQLLEWFWKIPGTQEGRKIESFDLFVPKDN